MIIPNDWRSIRIPLAWVAAAAFSISGIYAWAHAEFALASDFRQHKIDAELARLTTQQQMLKIEVTRLRSKARHYPGKFDAVDKDVLDEQQKVLNKVETRIEKLRKIP